MWGGKMIYRSRCREKLLGAFCSAFLMILSWPVFANPVAIVSRLAGEVEKESPSQQKLFEGASLFMGDVIVTGHDARIEMRFVDGMILTLGEDSQMKIDRLIYDPSSARGEVALKVSKGAFRVITGGIAKLPDHPFVLATPFASIGVRGTDFWGGPLDDPFAMISLDGTVIVSTPGGDVVLSPGEGTEISALGERPTEPHSWTPSKLSRAVKTISFPSE
jgi:hypothetical protein